MNSNNRNSFKTERVFSLPNESNRNGYVKSLREYRQIYEKSIKDPSWFWAKQAEQLVWFEKWPNQVYTWDPEEVRCTWFEGGKLNASYNCLDRHLKTPQKDKIAIIWESDTGDRNRMLTYGQLHHLVNRFANVLKKHGVKKGNRVAIYLPMIPELPIAMLACARIGAVHSVVFGGFSAKSLRDRILDLGCTALITCDDGIRGGKVTAFKKSADLALEGCPAVRSCFVVKNVGNEVAMNSGRDFWWHEELAAKDIADYCKPTSMDAEDPLFILYTSGSTGKPKGVLHTTGGYLIHALLTFKWVFNYHEKDIFWCTADIGWITGHSYVVYSPLVAGATSIMFEGTPTYPNPDRFWQIIDKYKVTKFYTAPTVVRSLMRQGDDWVKRHDLSSLKLLGTVGEPINPEAWIWYYKTVGREKCPIVDTYWQTETGGAVITPIPGIMSLKPGSATLPFPGIEAAILNEDGGEANVNEVGYLVIKRPWPGMMRTVYGNHQRFVETYWKRFQPYYMTGDGARRDEDGYFWIIGRIDDVIDVSGHRIGSAEVESALVSHQAVAEAAVVGFPHEIKGQALYCFVTLKNEFEPTEKLMQELRQQVRLDIGPIATPDKIQFTDALPKTRSGKIMRRILKKIAVGDFTDFGDTTTLDDPAVVERLVNERV